MVFFIGGDVSVTSPVFTNLLFIPVDINHWERVGATVGKHSF